MNIPSDPDINIVRESLRAAYESLFEIAPRLDREYHKRNPLAHVYKQDIEKYSEGSALRSAIVDYRTNKIAEILNISFEEYLSYDLGDKLEIDEECLKLWNIKNQNESDAAKKAMNNISKN